MNIGGKVDVFDTSAFFCERKSFTHGFGKCVRVGWVGDIENGIFEVNRVSDRKKKRCRRDVNSTRGRLVNFWN